MFFAYLKNPEDWEKVKDSQKLFLDWNQSFISWLSWRAVDDFLWSWFFFISLFSSSSAFLKLFLLDFKPHLLLSFFSFHCFLFLLLSQILTFSLSLLLLQLPLAPNLLPLSLLPLLITFSHPLFFFLLSDSKHLSTSFLLFILPSPSLHSFSYFPLLPHLFSLTSSVACVQQMMEEKKTKSKRMNAIGWSVDKGTLKWMELNAKETHAGTYMWCHLKHELF